jgi:hypothetical protein
MPLLPLAHAGHWFVGLIYLAPVAVLVVTLLVIGRRDRRAETEELRQAPAHEGPA